MVSKNDNIDNSIVNGLFKEVSGKEKMKVNWLQDIGPIYPADDYILNVLLHHPETENDGEFIWFICNNKEEAIAVIDHIIELNAGKDKFDKQEIDYMSHVFIGYLFNIGYRNELMQKKYVIVELNRFGNRRVVSLNDKSEILYGIHQDSKKTNSMIDGLNSIVYNSGEMTSGGGEFFFTQSNSHIVSYWSDPKEALSKFREIEINYSETAYNEIDDKEILKNLKNNIMFGLEIKTPEFKISLSKGTSSYQMNIFFT